MDVVMGSEYFDNNCLVAGDVAGDTLSRWRCRWQKRLESAGKSLATLLVISRQQSGVRNAPTKQAKRVY